MPIDILMPALSPTMNEGKLARWVKEEGETVEIGDVLAEIETDKATMEVEAVEEGRLGKKLVADGTDNVPVNARIGVLLAEGEDDSALKSVDSGSAGQPATAQGEQAQGGQAQGGQAQSGKAEPAASPGPSAGQPAPQPAGSLDAPQPGGSAPLTHATGPTGALGQQLAAVPEIDEAAYYRNATTQTVREAVRDAIAEEMRRDPDVFLMGEEVAEYEGAYKATQGLLKEFGYKRVIDTPITEHGFAGIGVGAAFTGLKPIVEFMTFNFAMQAMDQLINSAAKTRYMSGGQMASPIVFRGPNGPGARVGAQHSQDYASWYGHVPGLKVISPYFPGDYKGLLKAAIRDPNPVMFLEQENLYGMSGEVPNDDDFILPIGKARIVREGSDVTIVCLARGVGLGLAAAETLAGEGIQAEVIDMRTVRPLDLETPLASLRKTNRLVTVDETWRFFGFGSEIAAQMQELGFDYLDAPILRVSQQDVPMPYAANLEALSVPSADSVAEAVRQVCYAR